MNFLAKGVFLTAAITLVSAALLLLARSMIFRILHRWAGKTETKLDDIIIKAVKTQSLFWAIAIGMYIGIAFSDMPDKHAVYITRIINVLVILSITIATANLSGMLFRTYVQNSGLPLPTTGLAYGLLKGIILVIGFLIILSVLGISITPLITALGVGGLAVALALQDTLANLFAGIHVLMERSIRIGDFIRLETGQEGYVEDITWRTTRIRMMPNNMVVIPNNKLAQSVVTNYHLPQKQMTLAIPVSVSYASDPEQVEAVLTDLAKQAAGEVPGMLKDTASVVRFIPGFGPSSLDFTLTCQVREFADQYTVQHELRKRIWKRFRQEGIEMPFPTRTVYVKEEKTGDQRGR